MASKIKGITLEIGGDSSEFVKAANEADASMKSLGKEVSDINKGLKFDPSNVTLLGQKVDVTADRLKNAEEKLKSLKAAQKDVEDAFKSGKMGEEEYRAFQREVTTAESQVGNFKKQLKDAKSDYKEHNSVLGKAKDAVKNFSEEHPKAAKAIETTGKAAKALASGGLKLMQTGAKAAGAAVGALSAGAVALGKAVLNSAKDAAEYGNTIDKSSQKMGIAADEYQKLSYAANLSGTSMATLQKATQKLQKAGSDLDVSQALDQLYKIEDADERAAAAQEMFGQKIANELAPMLNQGGESFNAAKERAEEYGLVMSDAAIKASAAFQDTKTTMTDTIKMIGTNLASELLPGINSVMEGITGLFTGDEGAAKKIEDGINQLVQDLDGVVQKIVKIFERIMPVIIEMAPKVINTLSEGLLKNLDTLINAAFDVVQALVDGLLTPENIQALMNGAVSLLSKLVDFLGKNANMLVTSAITVVTTLIQAFSNPANMQTLIQGSIDMISGIVTALIDNAPMLISAALEMGKELVAALINYDWMSLAKKIYASIKNAIIGLFKGGSDDNSHAGGLDYVPYDNYPASLHRGEAVITAAENLNRQTQAQAQSRQMAALTSRVDALTVAVNREKNVSFNVQATGSYSQMLRLMNLEFKRINQAGSAW